MCVMSMVTDSIKTQWPPIQYWDYGMTSTIQQILEKIDALDKKLDTISCTDERKDRFIEQVKQHLNELENQQTRTEWYDCTPGSLITAKIPVGTVSVTYPSNSDLSTW